MAGAAYLLLPISGALAYFNGGDARTRFHGLQAIIVGLIWPLSLFVCSAVTPGATQIAAAVGAAVWLGLLVATALGRDPRLPLIGGAIRRASAGDPRAVSEVGLTDPRDEEVDA